MRLLVALPPLEDYCPDTGGAVSTVVEILARHWIQAGHELIILANPGPAPYRTGTVIPLRYRWPEPNPLRRLSLGAIRRARGYDWPAFPAYVADVRRALSQHQPDWLLLHNDLVTPDVLRGYLAKTRVAITLHNTVNVRRPDRVERILDSSAVVTAVSHFIADETTARFKRPVERVQVVHNGVENALYSGRVSDNRDGPLRVAFLGRLLPDKGPQLLVEAVETLHETAAANIVLTVVGSPDFARPAPAHAEFVQRIQARVEAQQGRYLSHQSREDVSRLLADQDVVVVPSIFDDPFALTVLEGMASGCAVITTRRGGLPESGSRAAIRMSDESPAALARELFRLDSDRQELLRRKWASLHRARDSDWSRVASDYLRLYE